MNLRATGPLAVITSLALSIPACQGGKSDPPEDSVEDSDKDDEGSSESGGGLDLMGGPGAFAMGSILANAKKPGLYDEPRESSDFDADEPHFPVVELSGSVVELESMDFWSDETGIELRQIATKLRELAADEQVSGMALRLGDLSIGLATADELRSLLLTFKGEGARTLACHAESASNIGFYLLSACDRIGVAPAGIVEISGVSLTPVHVKDLLDKLGVRAEFLHIGAFKGAAEPLTRSAPSKELVSTFDAILDQAYSTLIDAIAQGRKLDRATAVTLVDQAIFSPDEAVSAGLIDAVAVFSSFRDQVVGDKGWRVSSLGDDDEPDLGRLMELIGMSPRKRISEPHVALVYALGDVVDGKGGGVLGARSQIASRPLAAALRALAGEESVTAVVIRINSGGGSALASDVIWHAVAEVREKKPVIVSMGDMAASGGYYIACGANKIYADSNTLTGSIGVVGGKLIFSGALDDIGVKTYPLSRGKRAQMWSAIRPWSTDERTAVHKMMSEVYELFRGRVAAGRNKTPETVEEIAQGRVWTGVAALDNGLVDELGGLEQAIAEARKLGSVSEDTELEIYPPEPTLLDFVSSIGAVSLPAGMSSAVATTAEQLGPDVARPLRRLLEQLLAFRASAVQTTLLWPVVVH